MKEIAVSLICRNEEAFIERCLESIFNQSIQPSLICIVDDGSTDNTIQIIKQIKKNHRNIILSHTNMKRIHKGWNISYAINQTMHIILDNSNADIIIRLDSDAILTNKDTFKLIIKEFENNSKLGVTGAYHGKRLIAQVCDAVRGYRRECIKDIMKYNHITPSHYPVTFGHDSYTLYLCLYLGWLYYAIDVEYNDLRPYKRNLKQWYNTGRFRYQNGFTIVHETGTALRYIKQEPFILGSLIAFFSWMVSHVEPRIKDRSYLLLMNKYYDLIVVEKVRELLKGNVKEVVL